MVQGKNGFFHKNQGQYLPVMAVKSSGSAGLLCMIRSLLPPLFVTVYTYGVTVTHHFTK